MKQDPIRQVVFPILAALIWGTAFVAQDVCADTIGAFTFNAARYAIAVLALLVLIVLALFGSRIRRDWVFRLAALGALAVSLLEVVRTYTGVELAFLDLLPLASLGFGWVLPAAVGLLAGMLLRPTPHEP